MKTIKKIANYTIRQYKNADVTQNDFTTLKGFIKFVDSCVFLQDAVCGVVLTDKERAKLDEIMTSYYNRKIA
tara:strand:+ start:121 stop:336 length:216 start_codon:yes stop_codon:yes gene_type:complete